MLNKEGFSVMVRQAVGLSSSEGGGQGRGMVVSDHSAIVGKKEESEFHRLYLRYLG